MFDITDISSNECPASMLYRENDVDMMLEQYLRNKTTGCTTDQASTPIPLADAFIILTAEEKKLRLAYLENE